MKQNGSKAIYTTFFGKNAVQFHYKTSNNPTKSITATILMLAFLLNPQNILIQNYNYNHYIWKRQIMQSKKHTIYIEYSWQNT